MITGMALRRPLVSLALVALASLSALSSAQGRRNPFDPANLKPQYAPDRQFDLIHVELDLEVDYPGRMLRGKVVNHVSPFRTTGEPLLIHAGESLEVLETTVNGRAVPFKREGRNLYIQAGEVAGGKTVQLGTTYRSKELKGGTFGEEGGWHWIEPTDGVETRVGFWTQGETEYNSEWVPTWDYPNDFATSETRTTVPSGWEVLGNGKLMGRQTTRNTATFHWKMEQPHATYLLALYGGPLDIERATWEGVELLYVVPKGYRNLIAPSFDDTPDMLRVFSKVTGVKYPWNKYAQSAMYDFGGGMENVTNTILGFFNLTDGKANHRGMAGLNAHELAHQWFGDLVTCKTWGDIWLNESFATYFETVYMENARGKAAYEQETDGNMRGYFQEARRYMRPLSTNLYPDGDAMFDSHSYPKGAVILHTMRRHLGDDAFFKGINLYLTRHRHQPVETYQFERAMTDASGINMKPFFDQWIRLPGHPVIAFEWTWNEETKEVVATVKQTQNTANGTPIYQIAAKVGFIEGGQFTESSASLSADSHEFRFKRERKPDAVLFDPHHDFLRDYAPKWATEELASIVRFAPNAIDRDEALGQLMEADMAAAIALLPVIEADQGAFPVFGTTRRFANIRNPELRAFFRNELKHENFGRRTDAVRGLAQLGLEDEDVRTLVGLISGQQPTPVVLAAMSALADKGVEAHYPTLLAATRIESMRDVIANNAFRHLATVKQGQDLILTTATRGSGVLRKRTVAALGNLPAEMSNERDSALRACLRDADWETVLAAVRVVQQNKIEGLYAEVELASKRNGPYGAKFFLDRVVKQLSG